MRKIKCVNPWKPQAQRMYMIDGLAKALSANGGGQGGKTGLYLVSDMDKKVIDKNFTELEDGKYVTTTRKIKCFGSYNGHQSGNLYNPDGLSPALCSTDYKAPLKIITGGENLTKKEKDDVVQSNFIEYHKGKFVTTKERERLCDYNSPTQPPFIKEAGQLYS